MGKCSIRQALKFIDSHQQNPEKETAEAIASEFTLDSERVKNILKYYKMYEIQVPTAQKASKSVLNSVLGRDLLTSGKKESKKDS